MTRGSVDADTAWLHHAEHGPFSVLGRFAAASNVALLVILADGHAAARQRIASGGIESLLATFDHEVTPYLAVFKPRDGEAPLWDFPQGTLYRREVAAYRVAQTLGWTLVPATTVTSHEELGVGSLQRYVHHDPSVGWFQLRDEPDWAIQRQLRQMVVFDALIDNADRKASHVLVERRPTPSSDGESTTVRLVDHGVTFNVDRKLRTVDWDHAGEPIKPEILQDLRALVSDSNRLGEILHDVLTADEIVATLGRLDDLVAAATYPAPYASRVVPWPPW